MTANETTTASESSPARGRYAPVRNLVWARILEFIREPEAVFWVCIFPVVLVVALGIAFRNKPVGKATVDVVDEAPAAEPVYQALLAADRFQPHRGSAAECRQRLRTGKTDLVVAIQEGSASSGPEYEYAFDPARAESVLARAAVDDVLQRAAGRQDVAKTHDLPLQEYGARYIDFLVPGLVGMSIMGGGMWGIGFVTVDLRIRKLLKRFLATPMSKSQFLAGIIISRLVFLIPEVAILLLFSRILFGVRTHGSLVSLAIVILIGTITFAGIGLLVASRAKTVEAVSGLMNVVMLPMWMLSGIFFSSARFPAVIQPVIKILPLTPLIDMLRGIMQEGTSLVYFGPELAILVVYALVSFYLALRWFRWI